MFASIYDPNGWAVLGGCIAMITVIACYIGRDFAKHQTQIDDLKRELEEIKRKTEGEQR